MSEIKLKATRVFEENWKAINSPARFIVNEGGARSSKTYSIIQCLILICVNNPGKSVSVVRKTSPTLRESVRKDFIEMLQTMGIYDDSAFRKVESTYTFPNGSRVEFFSCDDPQKLRGRKRDIAWINEANEVDYDSFQQISMRTTEKIIVDYNPDTPESYLYELPVDRTVRIHSTYKDNPFLSAELIEDMHRYRDTDPNYYQWFTLGLRAFSRENIFEKWDVTDRPDDLEDFVYGLDLGYVHPTALVKVWYSKTRRALWVEELIYESNLTSTDLVKRMQELEIDPRIPIVSETARPEIIQDLRRSGFYVVEANKNVKDGLSTMKSFHIELSVNSRNLQKENFNYRYMKQQGKITETPIKLWDDGMDAIRYAVMYIKKNLLREPGKSSGVTMWSFEY